MNKFIHFFTAALIMCAVNIFADDEDNAIDRRTIISIDTKHIQNKTDDKKANFSALIDRLNHELVQCGLYQVQNYADVVETLKKVDELSVMTDDDGLTSNIQTPAWWIRMTVATYGVFNTASNDRLTGSKNATAEGKVELILQVIDMRTGTTLKSENISGNARTKLAASYGGSISGNIKEQLLQAACRTVCKNIVNSLVKLQPFYVLDVSDGEIMTDLPADFTAIGMVYDVFKPGKKIRNRRTGKMIQKESFVGKIVITKLEEEACYAKLIQIVEGETIKADYIIRQTSQAIPPPRPAAPKSSNNPW